MGWQGDPVDFGVRLHWEALRAGLGRAREQLVVADGAAWIWKRVAGRWPQSRQVLDFYHVSQHLWQLAQALEGEDESKVRAWAEQRRHRLRTGQERRVLAEIAQLKPETAGSAAVVRREQ